MSGIVTITAMLHHSKVKQKMQEHKPVLGSFRSSKLASLKLDKPRQHCSCKTATDVVAVIDCRYWVMMFDEHSYGVGRLGWLQLFQTGGLASDLWTSILRAQKPCWNVVQRA